MKKLIVPVIILLVVFAGIAFVSSNQKPKAQSIAQPSVTNLDSSKQTLDEFLSLNNTTPETAEAYRFAKENPQDVLSTVKCYCGCLKNNGHKNNKDCFLNEDGSFDLMGLNCGLCVKIALTSKQMLTEGKTVQEISDYVDARWEKSI